MANAVIARQQGDDYNARFFWLKSCRLFQDHSKVDRVGYELDGIKSFDDTVVFYGQPIPDERGEKITADYFQVKFHVDQKGAFTWQALMEPSFIGATKFSLLQRVYEAKKKFDSLGIRARLTLVSPWGIHPDDLLSEIKSNTAGELRLHVLFDGTTDSSRMGNIRKEWREHLGLTTDDELEAVLTILRIHCNAWTLERLQDELNLHLGLAGLVPVEEGTLVHPYDDLIRKLHASDQNEFTRGKLEEICKNEKLWRGHPIGQDKAIAIGIRSFMRWAENMEDETEKMLCLVQYFDGRQIKDNKLWQKKILPEITDFLGQNTQPGPSYKLLLDTHSSIAFTAGYCLNAKSRVDVAPVQSTRGKRVLWCPDLASAKSGESLGNLDSIQCSSTGNDAALAISVTHNTLSDVKIYVEKELPNVGRILNWQVKPQPGSTAVRDATHALHIVEELTSIIKNRSPEERAGTLHIFSAAPNALLFFLGQSALVFGRCILYEFDFDTGEPGAYQPSISFPPQLSKTSSSSAKRRTKN